MGKLIRNGVEYGGGNGTDIYEVTQSQYNTLKQSGTLVRNALYVITDAPNLNETADDIEYSTGVSVYDKIDNLAIGDLSDVNTSGASTGDILVKGASGWQVQTPTYNAKCLKVAVIQASLPTSYTIVNNANTTVINNANIKTDNILSSFAVGSLADIPDNLLGCVFQWANGAVCVATDTLVMNGKLTLILRAVTSSQSISAVRLLCIGYDN